VELGKDEDGDPITTLMVEEAKVTKSARANLTGNETTALRMLDSALLHHPSGFSPMTEGSTKLSPSIVGASAATATASPA